MFRALAVPGLAVAALLLVSPAGAQGFGNVELGEILSACATFCFGDGCDAGGDIDSVGADPPFVIRGVRVAGAGDPDPCLDPAGAEPAQVPLTLRAGQTLAFDVDFVATELGFFATDVRVNGEGLGLSARVVPTGPCPEAGDDVLCLQDDRFLVRGFWRTRSATRGRARRPFGILPTDAGLLWFFRPDNWEMLVKVLDGCPVNGHHWVFYAATTNVELTLTVTDSQEQVVRTYVNPLGTPATPVQDTAAFATCP